MSKKTKPFPGNPRKITPERLRTLGESLNEYGSLDGFVVNVGPGKYENCIISGNQKNKHINLAKAKIDIVERYDTPTETGTVAIGHVTHNGELFPYREVIWDDRKCEIGNIRANNLGGRNDLDLLNQFEADILEAGGIDMDFEAFVGTFRVGDGGDESETYGAGGGFSDKNKEIDTDAFEDKMVINLKYTEAEYWEVKERLSHIAQTPEAAVWKLLNIEDGESA